MIRYISIGNQIIEGYDQFAFFDTVIDKFLEFDGEQVFSNVKEFEEFVVQSELKDRCWNLIPEQERSDYVLEE